MKQIGVLDVITWKDQGNSKEWKGIKGSMWATDSHLDYDAKGGGLWLTLRGPFCAHDVAGIPYEEVRNNYIVASIMW